MHVLPCCVVIYCLYTSVASLMSVFGVVSEPSSVQSHCDRPQRVDTENCSPSFWTDRSGKFCSRWSFTRQHAPPTTSGKAQAQQGAVEA